MQPTKTDVGRRGPGGAGVVGARVRRGGGGFQHLPGGAGCRDSRCGALVCGDVVMWSGFVRCLCERGGADRVVVVVMACASTPPPPSNTPHTTTTKNKTK
jgi:hypothetical protein